ncbi:hypothetical protein [Streptomyces orinoci]|uniref:Uncharacterized protein n=1 Tax=Streptomyces orinoci TaxID=67339 RepID=A0ABV3JVD1_STRON|nr:hypothetical protein [Streptomyces orinoci]
MTLRPEVEDMLEAGPFPSEDASVEEIAETQRLLERIKGPISDEEAQALTTVFGEDNCFGLSWTLLHLIETAPGAQTAEYTNNPDNMWIQLLNARVESIRNQFGD